MSFILLGILNSQVPPSGGAGAYDLLETQTLGTAAASVTFTGLSSYSNYKHLQIRAVVRGDRSANDATVLMRFNSDTGSNYAWHFLGGTGGTVNSSANTTQTSIGIGNASAANFTANGFGALVIDVLDFSSTNKNTTVRSLGGVNDSNYTVVWLHSGLWNNTAAVASMTFLPESNNFVSGSRFSLYGIK